MEPRHRGDAPRQIVAPWQHPLHVAQHVVQPLADVSGVLLGLAAEGEELPGLVCCHLCGVDKPGTNGLVISQERETWFRFGLWGSRWFRSVGEPSLWSLSRTLIEHL
jgi:hypothetical protein